MTHNLPSNSGVGKSDQVVTVAGQMNHGTTDKDGPTRIVRWVIGVVSGALLALTVAYSVEDLRDVPLDQPPPDHVLRDFSRWHRARLTHREYNPYEDLIPQEQTVAGHKSNIFDVVEAEYIEEQVQALVRQSVQTRNLNVNSELQRNTFRWAFALSLPAGVFVGLSVPAFCMLTWHFCLRRLNEFSRALRGKY